MSGSVAVGIKSIVREKGLKQIRVAEKAGFTPQQFSAMLNGKKLILAEYMPRIANALDVDVMEIYIAGCKAENNGG